MSNLNVSLAVRLTEFSEMKDDDYNNNLQNINWEEKPVSEEVKNSFEEP